MEENSVKDNVIKTVMAVIVATLAAMLVYVCDNFTVPVIATWITIALCGVAGWSVYRVCKIWILKLFEKWSLKRKQ